ncbi:MAG: hypothetical protein ABH848_05320 [Candidatus Omnitrophota bacterium]
MLEAVYLLVSIFTLLVAIIGHILLLLKIQITVNNFLFGFYIILFVGLLILYITAENKNYFLSARLEIDKLSIICSAIIFFIIAVIFSYKLYPDFIPLKLFNELVDGGTHLNFVNRIFPWSLSLPGNFGVHFNVALFSKLINNTPFIKTIYPIMVIFTALYAVGVYSLIIRLKISGHLGAIAGGMLVSLSSYSISQLNGLGFYPQIFGTFLFIAYLIFLAGYLETFSNRSLFFLILISLGICVSYARWFPSLIISLIWASIITRHKLPRKKMLSFIFVIFIQLAIFIYLAVMFLTPKKIIAILKVDAGVLVTKFPIYGKLMDINIFGEALIIKFVFILFIIGIIMSLLKRKNKILLAVFFSIFIQTIFFYIGINKFSFGTYCYYKSFYLLYIPYIIIAIYGAQILIDFFNKKIIKKFNTKVAMPIKLVIFLPLLCFSLISGIIYSRYFKPAISSSDYDVALFVRKYLYNYYDYRNLSYIGSGLFNNFFLRAFLQEKIHPFPGSSKKVLPTNERIVRWLRYGKEEFLYVPKEFSSFIRPHLSKFKIFYEKEGTYLLARPVRFWQDERID